MLGGVLQSDARSDLWQLRISPKLPAKYGTQISDAGIALRSVLAGRSCYWLHGHASHLVIIWINPRKMKLGVAFAATESVTLTADYKLIQWGSAAGYKDFNWKDQNIVAIGAKYAGNGYWLGLGYNHANDPIGTTSSREWRIRLS